MISKPLPWIKKNNSYIGGYYRHDLYNINLIHKSNLHNHNIENLDNLVKNINYLQSQTLYINKLLLHYLNNSHNHFNEFKQNVKILANNFNDLGFYIPIFIDWRSRIYSYSSILSYQGDSLARSLVYFNIKDKLNNEGFLAFQYYTANVFKYSLKSNIFKFNWFEKNKDRIYNKDPELKSEVSLSNKYEFINCCLHYKKYIDNPYHIFEMCISFDSTCSGIQHISGIFNDVE